jgi:iron complex outermembrane recepter protein
MFRFSAFTLALFAAPAVASDAPPTGSNLLTDQAAQQSDRNQILVIATRLNGELDVPQPPVATLNEAEIAAYGAASIADLLTALAPQTASGRGRGGGFPVVLINGQRVASFREMRNFPPEAIRKVEVLPEEVALRFGYPPNSRVVNFILKDSFASKTIEVEFRQPWAGGSSTTEFEASMMRINGPRRLNLTATISDTTPLTEAERNIIPSVPIMPGQVDPAPFRTLIADSRDLGLNMTWSKGLGSGGLDGQLSLNAAVSRSDNRSLSGLDLLGEPLARVNKTTSLQAGAGFNRRLGEWQLSATLDGNHGASDTRIDRPNGSGFDTASATSDSLTSLVTLIGQPLRLPAGEVGVTLKSGYTYTGLESRDTRSAAGVTNLSRNDVSGGINFGLPLTSRRENVLGGIGDVALNFSAGLSHLSDFGTLKDWSAGLSWAPTEKLGLQLSYIVNEAAPGLSDLGGPITVTFNVPTYDFVRGETVLAAISGGGNRALRREMQRDLKISGNWQLPILSNSSLLIEYFRNRSENVTASFPLLTPAIESAFPGRVTRDSTGRLVAIDRRPVTLAQQSGSRLRWGLNLSGTIGKAPPGGGPARTGSSGGPGGGGGMRGMGGMFGGTGGQGRWNVSLFHSYRLSEQVLIASGGPSLDLLGGDALAGGGLARHTLELESGTFHKGMGVRVVGRYSSPTIITGSGLPGSSDLRFSGLFGFDLRVFADLGQKQALTRLSPFFKGARLSFRIDNIFDARQKVTDGSGAVPLSYQRDYVDPRGRVIELELRKMF